MRQLPPVLDNILFERYSSNRDSESLSFKPKVSLSDVYGSSEDLLNKSVQGLKNIPYGDLAKGAASFGAGFGAYNVVANEMEPSVGEIPAAAIAYPAAATASGLVHGALTTASALGAGEGIAAAGSAGLAAGGALTAAELMSPLGWGLAVGIPTAKKIWDLTGEAIENAAHTAKAERELENRKLKSRGLEPKPEINVNDEITKSWNRFNQAFTLTP